MERPRPAGFLTFRGQFYGSMRAMPAHEHSTAEPVYKVPVPTQAEVDKALSAFSTEDLLTPEGRMSIAQAILGHTLNAKRSPGAPKP